jgi:hypothetical protein
MDTTLANQRMVMVEIKGTDTKPTADIRSELTKIGMAVSLGEFKTGPFGTNTVFRGMASDAVITAMRLAKYIVYADYGN